MEMRLGWRVFASLSSLRYAVRRRAFKNMKGKSETRETGYEDFHLAPAIKICCLHVKHGNCAFTWFLLTIPALFCLLLALVWFY